MDLSNYKLNHIHFNILMNYYFHSKFLEIFLFLFLFGLIQILFLLFLYLIFLSFFFEERKIPPEPYLTKNHPINLIIINLKINSFSRINSDKMISIDFISTIIINITWFIRKTIWTYFKCDMTESWPQIYQRVYCYRLLWRLNFYFIFIS